MQVITGLLFYIDKTYPEYPLTYWQSSLVLLYVRNANTFQIAVAIAQGWPNFFDRWPNKKIIFHLGPHFFKFVTIIA